MIEITLGITPRNPRAHTKGSLYHTKDTCIKNIYIYICVRVCVCVCVFLRTHNSWNNHLVNDVTLN